jgi:hypothetical protein
MPPTGGGQAVGLAPRRNDDAGKSQPRPLRHRRRGRGHRLGGQSVPHRKLADAGRQRVGMAARHAHGVTAAQGIDAIMRQDVIVDHERNGTGTAHAGTETFFPSRRHRTADEILGPVGQHDMQLQAHVQSRFGQQDVAAAGQRTKGETGIQTAQLCGNFLRQPRRILLRQGLMTAIINHRRNVQALQQRDRQAARRAHRQQLFLGRGQARRRYALRPGGLQHRAGLIALAQHQQRFGLGRQAPIVL